jgi:hypothetical protein
MHEKKMKKTELQLRVVGGADRATMLDKDIKRWARKVRAHQPTVDMLASIVDRTDVAELQKFGTLITAGMSAPQAAKILHKYGRNYAGKSQSRGVQRRTDRSR